MDRLFCPWRYSYVTSIKDPEDGCILCDVADPESGDDEASLIVHRAEHNFIVLNRFPDNTGHLMIVPYEHLSRLSELPEAALVEMSILSATVERVLGSRYHPDGMNVGLNLGRYAGAGIADHLHMHFVPRWTGDTSFISVLGETRVFPETLEESWQRLHGQFS
jgi:ATP adenylyltransferase